MEWRHSLTCCREIEVFLGGKQKRKKEKESKWQFSMQQLFGVFNGALFSSLLDAALRTGLLQAFGASGEPVTASVLAERAHTDPRVSLELCCALAAGGILKWRETNDSSSVEFSLPKEVFAALCDKTSPSYVGAFISHSVAMVRADRMADFLRTGKGYSFTEMCPDFANMVDQIQEPFCRHYFWAVIASHPELKSRLSNPSLCLVDIGCGGAQLLRAISAKNQSAKLHGLEIDHETLKQARSKSSSFANISFSHVSDGALAPGSVDFVIVSDVVHDATDPSSVFRQARQLINERDGIFLLIEPRTADSLAGRLADPSAGFKFGISAHACLAGAMSEEGGAALGTLGLSEKIVRKLAEEAGFGSVEQLKRTEEKDAFNAYYLIRVRASSKL